VRTTGVGRRGVVAGATGVGVVGVLGLGSRVFMVRRGAWRGHVAAALQIVGARECASGAGVAGRGTAGIIAAG